MYGKGTAVAIAKPFLDWLKADRWWQIIRNNLIELSEYHLIVLLWKMCCGTTCIIFFLYVKKIIIHIILVHVLVGRLLVGKGRFQMMSSKASQHHYEHLLFGCVTAAELHPLLLRPSTILLHVQL